MAMTIGDWVCCSFPINVMVVVLYVPSLPIMTDQRCSKLLFLPPQSHVHSYTGSERYVTLKRNSQTLPQALTSLLVLDHMIIEAALSLHQLLHLLYEIALCMSLH